MKVTSYEDFAHVSDINVDYRLIPDALRQTTNHEEIEFCKIALQEALKNVLSEDQRELIIEFYWQECTKKDMAQKRGVVHSTIVKRMQTAEGKLKRYIEFSLMTYRKYTYYKQ